MSMNRRDFLRMSGLGVLTLLTSGCGLLGSESSSAGSIVGSSDVSSSKAETAPTAGSNQEKKTLVAYFSRTGDNFDVGFIEKGNTHIVADMIAEDLGRVPTFEIKTVKEYPADYRETTEVAKKEKSADARPALADKVTNMRDYDVIFLGYPIWWSDLPMAVYTFLESYDFNGKTIIPFCTSAGDVMTGMEEHVIPEHAKGAKVQLPGLGIEGKRAQRNPDSVRPQVKEWLKKLGY